MMTESETEIEIFVAHGLEAADHCVKVANIIASLDNQPMSKNMQDSLVKFLLALSKSTEAMTEIIEELVKRV